MEGGPTIRDYIDARKKSGMSWDDFRALKNKSEKTELSDAAMVEAAKDPGDQAGAPRTRTMNPSSQQQQESEQKQKQESKEAPPEPVSKAGPGAGPRALR
ncbi:hypothetical protein DL89DRAFT_319802 [Linderina pennispora]|uniref:Uncharacterized protein n=1 Tax=Linderina pennispora TaxID=61395 RepID=A0A1Y1WLN7_9FUNG|nr:uncharacterized protein DL89DRAFT_319802 [Linderina pennispora]ORX74208.1 hypothetical protein DL89DRAFT_319802 [Linderina pennispora]